MGDLDFKYYWSVFLRRLPYFLVISFLLTAIAVTTAYVLPPVYRSSASMLVEPQQISDDLAQTTVPVNPFEQAQIIEQRLMTRVNLEELGDRIGLYDDQPELSVGARVGDIRDRIEFIGFTPDVTRAPGTPGAIIIGVAFEAPTGELANRGANELVNLVLEENVRIRQGQARGTLEFFQSEVERLEAALEDQSARISEFKTANFEALPDSLATRRNRELIEQERLLALEREESALNNERASLVWLFERTGRSATINALTPEEEQLELLRSEMTQQLAIYNENSPTIRVLQNQIAVLEALVEQQRADRMPEGEDMPEGARLMSELDLELAPIDARLDFIAEEKAIIEVNLAELQSSIQATPLNEMVLGGLEREYDSLNAQYDEAVANLGQAQVGERIEVLAKGERFSLIEEPTVPGRPVRPKRMLISAAGVVGGMGAGFGFIFLMEMLNRSIRRPVDISSQLGIQPFATVPYIRSPGEARRKRIIVITVLVLIAVTIPATLFALHTYYLPLDLILAKVLEKIGIASSTGTPPA